jgi:hypothetical protein
VLRSFPSQVFGGPKYACLTSDAEQMLIDSAGCFQILYDHQLGDLQRYRALVLAGCVALSDQQCQWIRSYVQSGGHVCLAGATATHDEWLVPRLQSTLDDLPASQVVRVAEGAGLLDAVRAACGGELTLSLEAKPADDGHSMPLVATGEPLYTDRDFVISRVPDELHGLPTVRFSVDAAKRNSRLQLRACVPVRIYVAFAKKGFSPQWLDPQPDWGLYQAEGFDSTIVTIGKKMDIYYRDFPAGEVRLFEGQSGTYVLLGVKAQEPGFKGCPFTLPVPPLGVAGLCAEVTDQPDRRLVHLVNYRSDGPIASVSVSLRLPAGRRVKSVTLASPEREQDLEVPHLGASDRTAFVVPQVGVYEIAVVAFQ